MKITCNTIFRAMNTDQIYKLGILLAQYDLLEQQILLRNYVAKEYGEISCSYLDNLLECEQVGKDYPRSIAKMIYTSELDTQAMQMCAIIPVQMFQEIVEAIKLDESFSFKEREQIQIINNLYLKLNRRAMA